MTILARLRFIGVILVLVGGAVISSAWLGGHPTQGLVLVNGLAHSTDETPHELTPEPTALATVTPTPAPEPTEPPRTIVGLAVLGDSTQDEYQADHPRGAKYQATTLNWVEQLVVARGINLGTWGDRDEPRRRGNAFNWARSGATSQQMISTGQHIGAAQQARDGEVSHAVIQIGINDFYFSGLARQIYSGSLSGQPLEARLNFIADNIMLAARTLKATGRCEVLVVATQDYVSLPIVPEIATAIPDPVGRQRVVEAFATVNRRLMDLAAKEGLPFFDFNAAYLAEVQRRLDAEGFLTVDGTRIDLRRRGNSPDFGLLDDEYVHPGTVLSGLYANVYIEAMNRTFQTAIVPLSDEEIRRLAGIRL